MNVADESRDTVALSKNFEDLVLEIEEMEKLEREQLKINQDQTVNFVKVYYITGDRQETTRAPLEVFIKALESCKNLCDLRKTYQLRSDFQSKGKETVLLTPKFEPHSKEIYCNISELKISHSENILDKCLQFAKQIQQDYKLFKAFIILDDYEDMDYLATGVSLLMRNLNKFVIFTGGITSIDLPNSDTNTNLVTALLFANAYFIPEVTVLQDGCLFRANRVTRNRCESYYKFNSPNYPPLATAFNFDIKIDWQLTRKPPSFLDSRELLVEELVNRKVTTIHLVPDANSLVFEVTYNSPELFEGVIIEAFGQGNLPGNSVLKDMIPKRTKEGMLTFIISQCHRGNVGDSYSTSGSYIGAILCGDMTLPATFVKVSLILARSRDCSEVSEMVKANWRGEITEEPLLQRHKTGQVMRYWGKKLKRYFQAEEDVRTVVREVIQSVLFSSVKFNDVVSADELLLARPNLKYYRTKENLNLLHAAMFHFSLETFEYLKKQYSLDELTTLVNTPDTYGYTPILYALCLREKEPLVVLAPLAKEVRFEDLPLKLRANLFKHALEGDVESLEMYVLAGFKKFQSARDVEGRSVVHMACSLGHLGLVKLFVDCCKAAFQEVDDELCNPADLGTEEVRDYLSSVDWESAGKKPEENPFMKKKPAVVSGRERCGSEEQPSANWRDPAQATGCRKESDSESQ